MDQKSFPHDPQDPLVSLSWSWGTASFRSLMELFCASAVPSLILSALRWAGGSKRRPGALPWWLSAVAPRMRSQLVGCCGFCWFGGNWIVGAASLHVYVLIFFSIASDQLTKQSSFQVTLVTKLISYSVVSRFVRERNVTCSLSCCENVKSLHNDAVGGAAV